MADDGTLAVSYSYSASTSDGSLPLEHIYTDGTTVILNVLGATSATQADACVVLHVAVAAGDLLLPVLTVSSGITDVDAYLDLPLYEVDGIIEDNIYGEAEEIELPLLDVSGEINDIYFNLTLPLLEVEGSYPDEYELELPVLSVEGTVLNGSIAAGDVVLPALDVSGEFGVNMAITLPLLEVLGTALAGATAEGQLSFSVFEVVGTGDGPLFASGLLSIPTVRPSGTIVQTDIISGVVTIPLMQVSGDIYCGLLAEGLVTLPTLTVDGTGLLSTEVTGSLTLPLLEIYAYIPEVVAIVELDGTTSSLTGYALVVNVENNGISEYTNFNFNSFANFQGKYLAAGAGGIFELTGDNDNETDIDSLIRTGQEDGGTSLLKRPEDAYVGVKADDALEASVVVDGNVEYDGSPIDPRTDGIGTQKVKFGKGIKSRYWALQIENTNGCNFEVESAELVLKPVERKI